MRATLMTAMIRTGAKQCCPYAACSSSRSVAYYSKSAIDTNSNYDLVVIGGGSGGLACSKEAADQGARVAVLDWVAPTPHGQSWGLGGTCVNVGCIPKKLMHQAALVGNHLADAAAYGWQLPKDHHVPHDWNTLKNAVQDTIKASNWVYRVQLNSKKVDYFNALGSFLDSNTIKVTDKKSEKTITAKYVVLSTGLRPTYPNIPGAELGLTSDDLFSLKKSPGRTLVVGGSYVGLECAGFLKGLGLPVDLMIRSIPLRGFDQQCANLITDHMSGEGMNILWRCSPLEVVEAGNDQKKVTWLSDDGKKESQVYDTVLWAIGRQPRLQPLNLQAANVQLNQKNGKVIVDDEERSSNPSVFAIGDIAQGRPELTPVAISTGQLLARRLFAKSSRLMNYDMIPTTVFTPLEYGCVGLSEEAALKKFGEDECEVYHAFYGPYEYTIPHRSSEQCYTKIIALRDDPKTVIGIHFVGPNAGEVTQGFAAAMTCNITIDQLQSTVAIHPTSAEEIIKLRITKRSGLDPRAVGCCG
uniref:thioredoxin-disulfide reductase (NADPH) n=1 Tax=Plectus sambesii TaxID=2011161 RepID=A0A914W4D5_9BILA